MASRFFVVDSGAVARQLRRLFVIDSGGVSRQVRRLFVVDAGGTSRLVFNAALLDAVLGVGNDGVIVQYGYNAAFFGTLTPATYNDAGANSRTVDLLTWDGATVTVRMNAAGIPNTDTTFRELGLDSTVLARSAATYNGAAAGGTRTQWSWASAFMHGGANVAARLYG